MNQDIVLLAESHVRSMAAGDQISHSTRAAIQSLAIVVQDLMDRAEQEDTLTREANE